MPRYCGTQSTRLKREVRFEDGNLDKEFSDLHAVSRLLAEIMQREFQLHTFVGYGRFYKLIFLMYF